MRINVHAVTLTFIPYACVSVRNFTVLGIAFIGLDIHVKRFILFGGI